MTRVEVSTDGDDFGGTTSAQRKVEADVSEKVIEAFLPVQGHSSKGKGKSKGGLRERLGEVRRRERERQAEEGKGKSTR